MIKYGDRSTVEGPVFTETVDVAGIQVTNQFFSPVTTVSDHFMDLPMDGVSALVRGLVNANRIVDTRIGIPCSLHL